MNDCINNLIDNRDRVTDIDWALFGQRFVTMIWNEEDYLEAYDRLRKTFKQRFPLYYHIYMEALPDDVHIRAIRSRYSMRHLTLLSYYEIYWWKIYYLGGRSRQSRLPTAVQHTILASGVSITTRNDEQNSFKRRKS